MSKAFVWCSASLKSLFDSILFDSKEPAVAVESTNKTYSALSSSSLNNEDALRWTIALYPQRNTIYRVRRKPSNKKVTLILPETPSLMPQATADLIKTTSQDVPCSFEQNQKLKLTRACRIPSRPSSSTWLWTMANPNPNLATIDFPCYSRGGRKHSWTRKKRTRSVTFGTFNLISYAWLTQSINSTHNERKTKLGWRDTNSEWGTSLWYRSGSRWSDVDECRGNMNDRFQCLACRETGMYW